jgi:hypothetical protein
MTQLTAETGAKFAVRTKASIVYELYDSYGNIIGPYHGGDNGKPNP